LAMFLIHLHTWCWVHRDRRSFPTRRSSDLTVSWKISIAKEANRPDLPRQKMHIDVCAIPSFDIEKRPLINHYDIVVPTEGILVRSEEHTSELQSRENLVCRLLLEKKNKTTA